MQARTRPWRLNVGGGRRLRWKAAGEGGSTGGGRRLRGICDGGQVSIDHKSVATGCKAFGRNDSRIGGAAAMSACVAHGGCAVRACACCAAAVWSCVLRGGGVSVVRGGCACAGLYRGEGHLEEVCLEELERLLVVLGEDLGACAREQGGMRWLSEQANTSREG